MIIGGQKEPFWGRFAAYYKCNAKQGLFHEQGFEVTVTFESETSIEKLTTS